jgi:hypothetical protein
LVEHVEDMIEIRGLKIPMSAKADDAIASLNLVAVCSDRGKFDVTLEIGAPYLFGPNEWVCPWTVAPFYSARDGAHGGDAFQALCLAISGAKSDLAEFVSRGGRLQYTSGEDFDLGPFNANHIALG